MSPEPQLDPARGWSLAKLASFRLVSVYFVLYCLTNQVLTGFFPLPFDVADPSGVTPVRATVFWVAAHIFHLSTPLVYQGSGSGDKTFDWVLDFCILLLAVCGAIVWSLLDRRQENYQRAHKWLVVFLRFAIGSQLLSYGIVKFVPLQMPFPSLARLMEPLGNFSPMGVLWSSIGASPAYETFAGSAEMFGAILLFFPRTALLGALVCLAEMTEVFLLNMTYDVPVKLFSFHLLLMLFVLLAPEFSRILRFLFGDRPVEASRRTPLFATARANRMALLVQAAYALLLIGMNAYGAWTSWFLYGGGAPRSPLYGIWNVEPPDLYRRVIFDRAASAVFQNNDDSIVSYGAIIDLKNGTLNVSGRQGNGALTFTRSGQDEMTIDGSIGPRRVHMQLARRDPAKLPLTGRGFHWIQDYPFNR